MKRLVTILVTLLAMGSLSFALAASACCPGAPRARTVEKTVEKADTAMDSAQPKVREAAPETVAVEIPANAAEE